jgi:hypothetical protein
MPSSPLSSVGAKRWNPSTSVPELHVGNYETLATCEAAAKQAVFINPSPPHSRAFLWLLVYPGQRSLDQATILIGLSEPGTVLSGCCGYEYTVHGMENFSGITNQNLRRAKILVVDPISGGHFIYFRAPKGSCSD